MELWIIYAFIGALVTGIFTFVQKIASQRGYGGFEFSFFVIGGQTLGALIFWGLYGFPVTSWDKVLLLGILVGILTLIVNVLRIYTLKYIDTTIFFPIYKALGPMVVTFAGMYLFLEKLNSFEIVGIVLGIVVPLLLIHKSEHKRQQDLKKGLLLLCLGVLLSTINVIIHKFVAGFSAGDTFYILIISVIGALAAWIYLVYAKKKKKFTPLEPVEHKKMRKLGFLTGFITMPAFWFVLKSYEGPLAIAYTINSFYILVPIVLSIIIYKEHVNTRKVVAIILSLFAIVLFQL